MGFFRYAALALSTLSGIWVAATALCCIPWVQRQMLYLHNIKLWWGVDLEKPGMLGFLKNQVTSFRILTKDGEKLYAWLVTPLGIYAKHAKSIEAENSDPYRQMSQTLAFRLLAEDNEARLLLYFHGNCATVAQGRRTTEYRMLSSGASDKIFILTFDYRGFGHSTGTPSETGCINDAIAVLEWAVKEANIDPSRIVLLGHSLGTAVATALAQYAIGSIPKLEFAGMVLVAGFLNAHEAFLSYAIGGIIPTLGPLRLFPGLSSRFGRILKDTWRTGDRLEDLVRKSDRIALTLVHAKNDLTMPWRQSELLFRRAVEGTFDTSSRESCRNVGTRRTELGASGYVDIWIRGDKCIRNEVVMDGGHDTVMTYTTVALAVSRAFGFSENSLLI